MSEASQACVEAHPQAAELDNPFRRRLQLIDDPQQSMALISQVLPLRRLVPACPQEPWWHYGHHSRLGSIAVSAGILPPARLWIAKHHTLTLILGYAGEQTFQQSAGEVECLANGCLILSGDAASCESSLLSTVALQLEPERLMQTALQMGGLVQSPEGWADQVELSQAWLPADPAVAPLQEMLRDVVERAERLSVYSQLLVERLQLDEQIYRVMAAMVLPELRLDSPLDRLRRRSDQGLDAFDELVAFINANLDQALDLSILQAHSFYSRRALQYAFQKRLGCTATQWIRNQRLDLARQRLQQPQPGDSVASIAASSGYRSMSLFSVDFQQRFHVKPSHLLREARAGLPPETW
ncbi:helix-turn-helix domain-containing protein [Vulcanococcus limneticus]|uniref:AraC family transcriptional regulator n=1 Tax=Vulcanococcus limneticus TaxID=2170428 RepID=UPI00398BCBEF